MSDTVLIALIGAVVAIVAGGMPWLLARQTAAIRAQERSADNLRQDQIAARVEEAARAAKAVSETLAATTRDTTTRLIALHEQGNSNLELARALALRAGLAEGNIEGRRQLTEERLAGSTSAAPPAIPPAPLAVQVVGPITMKPEPDKEEEAPNGTYPSTTPNRPVK